MNNNLLISPVMHENILRSYKFNRSFRNFKRPFVGIINTTSSIRLEWVVTRAPGPDIVTTLYQIIVDNVIVPRQVKPPIPALAVAGSFIQVERNLNWLPRRIHNTNDCCTSSCWC